MARLSMDASVSVPTDNTEKFEATATSVLTTSILG